MCARAALSYTTQHRTVPIIFLRSSSSQSSQLGRCLLEGEGRTTTEARCLQLRRTVGRLRESISLGDELDHRARLNQVRVRTIGERKQLP